ncbi:MAG: hypothetical protein KGH71_04420 [Candidatus Micrarchaeota archaeon]|nr:hypothetical protein [Candidatus Micrarchaeota archaeon]MDE1870198.1 hypothetical protein [Candidatus Micrarchaeota archaeon]
MRKKRIKKEFIEGELQYSLLLSLYKNSRKPIKALARELSVSNHLIKKVIEDLEQKYGIEYILDVDFEKLGFAESRLITIKFEKAPNSEVLKEMIMKDIFVQGAYIASGDFDLLLFVSGLSSKDFRSWQYNFRIKVSDYSPIIKFSAVNFFTMGFFPIRNELIDESTVLSEQEKRLLKLLNSNSKIKIKDLVVQGKTTQMKVLYFLKKMKEQGIIRKFSALTQNPDKRIFLAFGYTLTLSKAHDILWKEFARKLEVDKKSIINDYSIITDTNGYYDNFDMCAFKDTTILNEKGPDILASLWNKEKPKIEKAILLDKIIGKWPFHLEEYKESQQS